VPSTRFVLPLLVLFGGQEEQLAPVVDLHSAVSVPGVPTDDVPVGTPIEMIFDDITDTISLPRFRPRPPIS